MFAAPNVAQSTMFPHKPPAATTLLNALLLILLAGGVYGAPTQPEHEGGDPAPLPSSPAQPLEPKVLGGRPVASSPRQYPFMAFLKKKDYEKPYCGGTLIAPALVLTAKHCLEDDHSVSSWTVETHRYNATNPLEDRITYTVTHIMEHGFYDAAVLQLGSAKVRGNASPSLARYNRRATVPATGASVRVVGWGEIDGGFYPEVGHHNHSPVLRLGSPPSLPQIPHEADMPVKAKCYTSDYICAGDKNAGNCFGDSGGPLLHAVPGVGLVQVGIVTGTVARDCRSGGYYLRTSALADWLDEKMMMYGGLVPNGIKLKTTSRRARKTTVRKNFAAKPSVRATTKARRVPKTTKRPRP